MLGELDLQLPEPEVSPDEVKSLLVALATLESWQADASERNGWATATELAEHLGFLANERLDQALRWVRKIANSARPAVVSFPGSRGYKLWQLCTVEEIDHCIESFESQGRELIKCGVLYRQAYHKRFRGAPGGQNEACEPAPEPAKLGIR